MYNEYLHNALLFQCSNVALYCMQYSVSAKNGNQFYWYTKGTEQTVKLYEKWLSSKCSSRLFHRHSIIEEILNPKQLLKKKYLNTSQVCGLKE